jgi:hypothetical protein
LPFLDYRRYDDAKNLEEHYQKFKPCLDQLSKKDVSMEKFYRNHVFVHNQVEGGTHNPNANVLKDGVGQDIVESFQSTLELTTAQVNSLK